MSDDEKHNEAIESVCTCFQDALQLIVADLINMTQANAEASLTFPMQCSALRKNGHVVIKG